MALVGQKLLTAYLVYPHGHARLMAMIRGQGVRASTPEGMRAVSHADDNGIGILEAEHRMHMDISTQQTCDILSHTWPSSNEGFVARLNSSSWAVARVPANTG